MEVFLGALPSLLRKLGQLLHDEYKLQKEVTRGIMYLQEELESMKAALEDMSNVPADQLPEVDKIWARNVRELSYDIEDNIDIFMVQVKGHDPAKKQGFKMFIDKTLGSLMQPKIRRKLAVDIRAIKSRVKKVHKLRSSYKVEHSVNKHVDIDRALVQYEKVTELVGIEESREELIKILMEGNKAKDQNKIVSIVGFGGLGKTTLANVVYQKLKSQFDCSGFVSVSRTPDMERVFKDMLYELTKEESTASTSVIVHKLRGLLQKQRYLVVIDDIWECLHWETLKHAFPDDSIESRIIITTRNFEVAEKIGGPYKMKPLSLENSRMLMYTTIFGKEDNDKCPDEQLEEVSNRILKKCGGVPLAIIMITSLLARKGRNKLDWYKVCNYIGTGLEKDNTIENMRKVLLLSYYDMPSHLRTCLLYLSMFPEDYDIRKDRLIWLWIAEGFIEHEEQGKGLFEQGENYFNELVNRSMIQPKYDHFYKKVTSCHVHDMVLDLICSLSREENFVTINNNLVQSSAFQKVRRLSLQNDMSTTTLIKEDHVRSVIISGSFHQKKIITGSIPTLLENFRILRVLDLEGCFLSQGYSLKFLVDLIHLRYLGLHNTHINDIDHLPEEIGNLQFLKVLDVDIYGTKSLRRLPSSILRLTQLICLRKLWWTNLPEGFGSLIALEELSRLCIDKEEILEELAHLTELKVLHLDIDIKPHLDKSMVGCLNKLQKIQSLNIMTGHGWEHNLDGWVVTAPQNLRRLDVESPLWFAKLPAWLKVNPSQLRDLYYLEISVKRLQQEDLEILGRLPALHYLGLTVSHEDLGILGRLVVGACSFPCLVHCKLWGFFLLSGFGRHLVFEKGAMPRIEDIDLDFPIQQTSENNNDSFDLGLGNLPSLKRVKICFQSGSAGKQEVEEARAAVNRAIEVHPNNPSIWIR